MKAASVSSAGHLERHALFADAHAGRPGQSTEGNATAGRVADIGLALGARTAQSVTFARDLDRLNVIVDSNAWSAARLTSTQDALSQLSGDGADLPRAT